MMKSATTDRVVEPTVAVNRFRPPDASTDDGYVYRKVTLTPNMRNAGIDPTDILERDGFEIIPESVSPNGNRFYMRCPKTAYAELAKSRREQAERMQKVTVQSGSAKVRRSEAEREKVSGTQLATSAQPLPKADSAAELDG